MLEIVHSVRGRLHSAKGLVHYHMSGDQRFKVESALEEASSLIGELWSQCLSCPMSTKKEKNDAPDDL